MALVDLARRMAITAASLLILFGVSDAQEERFSRYVGSEDLGLNDMDSGGKPSTAAISGLTDITDYAFDGSDLTIPFTLEGTQTGSATVWLVIYTSGQKPPLTIEGEGPPPHIKGNYADPGWHVFQGVDWLVYRSDGERFDAGDNEIVWNGRDMGGNVVEKGSYDLFLAAFDADARAHIVGYAPGRGGTGEMLIVDPDAETLTRPYEWVVDMNNDFINNPSAATFIDRTEIHNSAPDAGEIPVGRHVFWWTDSDRELPFHVFDMTPLGSSGNITDDMMTYVANGQNQGGGLLFTGTYDPVAQTADVNEDWGADHGAVNGFIDYKELQPTRKYAVQTNPEKTKIYTTTGIDGLIGTVAVWDLASGENLALWDLSEIFLYDNNGSDRCGGPGWSGRDYAGQPPAEGLTLSGHHTSIVMRQDYDTGEIMWINRNGDGFGDMYVPKTFGEEPIYGHTSGDGAKYGMNATKWGWTSISHTAVNFTDYGSMLGEDGSGLFLFQPTNIPSSVANWTMVVDHDDSAWDGFYISVGENDPEFRSNDWAPPKPEDAIIDYYSYKYFVHLPYDQKRVSLGEMPTAVAELGGALPASAELGDAYPNPFNPETTIHFSLPWEAPVKVEVFNDQGQLVTTLVNDHMGPGNFSVTWDGRDANGSEVASGVYLYKIESVNLRLSKKVTFLK